MVDSLLLRTEIAFDPLNLNLKIEIETFFKSVFKIGRFLSSILTIFKLNFSQ